MALTDSGLTAAESWYLWPTPSTGASARKDTDSGSGSTVIFRLAVLPLKVLTVMEASPGAAACRRPPSSWTMDSSLTA